MALYQHLIACFVGIVAHCVCYIATSMEACSFALRLVRKDIRTLTSATTQPHELRSDHRLSLMRIMHSHYRTLSPCHPVKPFAISGGEGTLRLHLLGSMQQKREIRISLPSPELINCVVLHSLQRPMPVTRTNYSCRPEDLLSWAGDHLGKSLLVHTSYNEFIKLPGN